MLGPLLAVQVGMGESILILAFVVIVIGGIGSIRGALLGALLVGHRRHGRPYAAADGAARDDVSGRGVQPRPGAGLDPDLCPDGGRVVLATPGVVPGARLDRMFRTERSRCGPTWAQTDSLERGGAWD